MSLSLKINYLSSSLVWFQNSFSIHPALNWTWFPMSLIFSSQAAGKALQYATVLARSYGRNCPTVDPQKTPLGSTTEEQSCPLLLHVPIHHNLWSSLRNQCLYRKNSAQSWASPLCSYTTISGTKKAYSAAFFFNLMWVSLPFNFICLFFQFHYRSTNKRLLEESSIRCSAVSHFLQPVLRVQKYQCT